MCGDRPGRRHCRESRGLKGLENELGVWIGNEPADSLPITNVTGECCFTSLLRVDFAVWRKDRRDARANGILMC